MEYNMISKLIKPAQILCSIGIALTVSACATSANSQAVDADARASIGTITQKQTLQQYEQRRTSPVDVNVGIGGGGNHIGWGISFGLAQILLDSAVNAPRISYRYTVETRPYETYVVQTSDEFALNQCVTVWLRSNDASYPRIQNNNDCNVPK